MPVPYMGSKRKSGSKIYQTIVNLSPKFDTIYDLFCGGFAIGEIFVKNGYKVIANDKNKYVVALIDQAIKGLDEKKVTQWVSLEEFIDIANNPQNYEDWYVGYVQCCWSFGNTQTNYLFADNIEQYKKNGHELVINKNYINLIGVIPKKYIDGILNQKDWQTRRIALKKVANLLFEQIVSSDSKLKTEYARYLKIIERKFTNEYNLIFTKWLRSTGITPKEVNSLTNSHMASHYLTNGSQPAIPTLEQWQMLKQSPKIKACPDYILDLFAEDAKTKILKKEFKNLERLEKLEKLEPNIRLNSKSYDEIEIKDGSIIYCDPPYFGTAEYKEGGFEHKKFWNWVREKSRTNTIYISEYNAPDDFEAVLEFAQKSTLQGGTQKHNNQQTEKLFRIKATEKLRNN